MEFTDLTIWPQILFHYLSLCFRHSGIPQKTLTARRWPVHMKSFSGDFGCNKGYNAFQAKPYPLRPQKFNSAGMIKIDATLAVSSISHFQLRPLDLPMVGHLRHPLEEQRFLRQPQDYRLRNREHSGALGALISLIFEIPIELWQQVHATQSQGQDHESCGDATPQRHSFWHERSSTERLRPRH